jgi:hypothetical protein
MADPIEMNRRNWDERAAIHARDATGFYTLNRLRAGESAFPDSCRFGATPKLAESGQLRTS